MSQSEVEQIFFQPFTKTQGFFSTQRRILISTKHQQSTLLTAAVNKTQTHKKKQLQKWCKGGKGGKQRMRTSRKRRVLLRTAATSILCHLVQPWLQAEGSEINCGARTQMFQQSESRVQLCCYRRNIFKCLALLGLSSLEAPSIFSRKPAASSWHWGTAQGVLWERAHTIQSAAKRTNKTSTNFAFTAQGWATRAGLMAAFYSFKAFCQPQWF